MLSKNESNKKEKIQPKMEVEDSEEEIKDEIEDAVQKVRNATGCLVSVEDIPCMVMMPWPRCLGRGMLI